MLSACGLIIDTLPFIFSFKTGIVISASFPIETLLISLSAMEALAYTWSVFNSIKAGTPGEAMAPFSVSFADMIPENGAYSFVSVKCFSDKFLLAVACERADLAAI